MTQVEAIQKGLFDPDGILAAVPKVVISEEDWSFQGYCNEAPWSKKVRERLQKGEDVFAIDVCKCHPDRTHGQITEFILRNGEIEAWTTTVNVEYDLL